MEEVDRRYNPRDVDPHFRNCVICSDFIDIMSENVYWHSNCMKPIHTQCFMSWISRNEDPTIKCLNCFKEEDRDYFLSDIADKVDTEFAGQYPEIQYRQNMLQQQRVREREIGYVANMAYQSVRNTIENIEQETNRQMTGPRRLLTLAGFMAIGPFIGKEDFLSELIITGTVAVTVVVASFFGPETALGRRFPGGGKTSRNSLRNSLRNSKPKIIYYYLTNHSDINKLKKSLTKKVVLCTLDVPDTNETKKIINKCISDLNFKVHESNEQNVINSAEKRMSRIGLKKRSYRPSKYVIKSLRSITRSTRRSRKHLSNRSATRNSRRNMSRKFLPKWI